MRSIPRAHFLPVITLCLSITAWGQGGNGRAGRAAAAAQQAGAPANATGRGGGGGAPAGAASGAATEFFNFDSTATMGQPIPDAPPAETHQKISLNGESVAYTARVGYLTLRNATTGQAEAHLFYTCYSKDGVSDESVRPVVFFLGGAPGVAASWQEFGGLGPKRMKWASDGSAGSPPFAWGDNP